MSQLTIDLALDNYRSTLSQAYNWWSGSIYVNNVPNVSFPTGKKVLLTVNPEKTNMQVVELDWRDSVAKTLNCTWATVKRGEWANYSATDHSIGSEVKISIPYDARDDIKTAVNTKVNTNSTDTDTGKFADAAARDAYFTSPVNGNSAYLTAEGKRTDYVGGAWVDRATGSTPNASTTVAGKVEISTQTETEDQTATWWTWATVVPTNVTINPNNITSTAPATGDKISFADISNSNKLRSTTIQTAVDTVRPLATNAEASTGTGTTQSVTPLQLTKYYWPAPIAWTTITDANNSTSTFVTWVTPTKKKSFTIPRTGSYTVTFNITRWWWSGLAYGRIYKNGVALWTLRNSWSTSPTFDSFSENLSFTEWDTCELRLYQSTAWQDSISNSFMVQHAPATGTVTIF